MVSEDLAKEVFSKESLKNADNKICFNRDDEGNWDGTFTCQETQKYASFIANGNEGTGFDLSAMDNGDDPPLISDRGEMHFDIDEASNKSFKTAMNNVAPDAKDSSAESADGGLPTARTTNDTGDGSPAPTDSEEAASASSSSAEEEAGGGGG